MKKLFIRPVEGYSPQLGILISQMQIVRNETLRITKNLSKYELDINLDDSSNSIGTLLLHISALELNFSHVGIYKTWFSELEWKKYKYAHSGKMIHRKIVNNELIYYIKSLEYSRKTLLDGLKMKDDKWLFSTVKNQQNTVKANYLYLLWHLMEDELKHQGQITWILKRIKT